MDPNSPEGWYKSLPRVTRILATATFAVTVLVVMDLLDFRLLLLDWHSAFSRLQLWRLVTDYLFLGKFSFSWIFQMYFFVTFSSKLEQNEIFSSNSRGAYLYFLLLQIAALDLTALFLLPSGGMLMGPSLHFAIIYYWSRREPWAQVGLWGFNIQAYQLPFALILLDVLMGGSIWTDLMGLFTGHLYYFVRELLPVHYNVDPLGKCPSFLDDFVGKLDENFSISSVYNSSSSGSTQSSSSSSNNPVSGGTSSGGRGVSQFSGTGHRLGGD